MAAVLEARAVITGEDRTKAAFESIKARIAGLTQQVAAVDRVMARMEQVSGPINKATQEIARFDAAAETMTAVTREVEAVRKSFLETATAIEKATVAAGKFGRTNIPRPELAMPGRQAGGGRASSTGHGRGHGPLSQLREAAREIGGGVAPVIGLGLVYEGAEVVSHAVRGGFERQHERTRMETAGMRPGEIVESEGLSAAMAAKYPAVSQTEIMHLMRNARSVVGSYDEAAKIIQPLLDLRVVAQGAHPGQDMKEEFDQLIKGMEIKGVTQDPAKFKSYINSMGKAVNAFGDTLRPTDFYEMFKYGRQSTSGFSQDYMMNVAPTLAQEMKGSSAGVANSAFFRAIVGGRMEKGALARLEALDLVDKSKLVVPKGGHIASAAGAIKGTELAQVNPYEWVNQILLPAMKKKGIVDPQKIQEVINSVFSNQVAAQMVGIYATQQARIEKDRDVIARTQETPQAARTIMEKDPLVAAEGLKNAIENLSSVFADKTLHLASTMTGMAEALNRYAANIQEAYAKQERGDNTPGEGQDRFNRFMNKAEAEAAGLPDPHSGGDFYEGKRRSQILQANQDSEQDPELRKAMEAKRAEAQRLRAEAKQDLEDAQQHEPKGILGHLKGSDGISHEKRTRAKLSNAMAAQLEQEAADLGRELERSRRAIEAAQVLDKTGQRIKGLDDAARRWADPADMHLPEGGIPSRSQPASASFGFDVGSKDPARRKRPSAPAYAHPVRPVLAPPPAPITSTPPFHPADDDRGSRARSSDAPLSAPAIIPHLDAIKAAIEAAPQRASHDPWPDHPHTPTPAFHPFEDHWLDGGRPGIERRSDLARDAFNKDAEAARGEHMMEHFGGTVEPQVDTSALDAADQKIAATKQHLADLGGTTADLKINMATVDAAISKLTQLKGLMASLGSVGGARANLGPSYPAAAPTGRMG